MDPQELVPLEAGIPPPIPRYKRRGPPRSCYQGPMRLCRLLALVILLPSLFVFVPLYLRYRVYSGQMYPMSMTDMRLIDSKISPTWCQRQVVRSNATFNAFVVPSQPELMDDLVPVSMTRELVLEDDMKEYWGFYLLRGSSVTVSACVRWPGASLIMIKGYKHLQACAYIGDDSSEELDELLEAHTLGLLSNDTLIQKLQELKKVDGKANQPEAMKRHKPGVKFHDPNKKANASSADTVPSVDVTDHDPKELREILERLHAIRQAQKTEAQKYYRPPAHLMSLPGLHRHRDTNVDRDERRWIYFKDIDGNATENANATSNFTQRLQRLKSDASQMVASNNNDNNTITTTKPHIELNTSYENKKNFIGKDEQGNLILNNDHEKKSSTQKTTTSSVVKEVELPVRNKDMYENFTKHVHASDQDANKDQMEDTHTIADGDKHRLDIEGTVVTESSYMPTERSLGVTAIFAGEENIPSAEQNSKEVFEEVLHRLKALGDRGKRVLVKLHQTMGLGYKEEELFQQSNDRIMSAVTGSEEELDRLRKVLVEAIDEEKTRSQRQQKRRDARSEARAKRELMLGQADFQKELNEDDEPRNSAAEEMEPDGYADHHVHLNETTPFDMSNSEFWSSFSSSEEALLECEGLILNLPLTPHPSCRADASEKETLAAAITNALTYRVPANGYYFFVFNSENEVQENYIRARFDLQKTRYDVARTKLRECTNSTDRCDLPLDIFTSQKVVLEVPLRDNDSLWNEQWVIISECEPRTSIYLFCVIAVPVLILIFAFQ